MRFHSFSLSVSLAALAAVVNAQDVPVSASATDLASVDAQYLNSGYANITADNQGFGFTLNSWALLSAVFGQTVIENGNGYSADQLQDQPALYITASNDTLSQIQGVESWTVMMTDANTWGHPDPQGNFNHFLASNVTTAGEIADSGNMTVGLNIGNVITPYAAPGPAEGDGPHRYAVMLFSGNPSDTDMMNSENTPISENGHWNVTEFVQSTGIEGPYAASLFTVQNGEPASDVSVVSTTPVDSATLAGGSSNGDATATGDSPSASGDSGSASDDDGSAIAVAGPPTLALGVLTAVLAAAA